MAAKRIGFSRPPFLTWAWETVDISGYYANPFRALFPVVSNYTQRKTKDQQLKGKIVSALFHTFWHFPTHFHTFSEFFLQDFFLELRGFTTVLAQRDEKRIKEIKKKRPNHFAR